MPNQIKNSNSVNIFLIKLDRFIINGKKENLRWHFWKLSDDLLNRI